MKLDQFAFFNQQLAAMLREGIPLEGALRQLTATMQQGSLRSELQALEADLSRGLPLPKAIESRQFPDLYRRLVAIGARGQDLAGFLSRLADHYHEQHLLWTRLQGLLTYPVLVLAAMFGLSWLLHDFLRKIYGDPSIGLMRDAWDGLSLPGLTQLTLPLVVHSWVLPASFGLLLILVLVALGLPRLRDAVLWQLPAFREATLARIANTFALLLERAVPLPEAVGLVGDLEPRGRVAAELRTWRERLAQGVTELPRVTAGGRFFPPLFTWLVVHGGAPLTAGFRRAAEIYHARAAARTEIMLHAALPVTVLILGLLIAVLAVVIVSLVLPFVTMLDTLGG